MNTASAKQSVFVNTPCHENYDQMIPTYGGKFCELCNHIVTDFTGWKQEDIIYYLQSRGTEQVCGRLRNSQLGNDSQQRSWITGMKISFVAVAALFLSRTEAKAQSKVAVNVQPQPNVISDSVVLLLRGEVKCDKRAVYNAKIIAINANGDTIASGDAVNGRFEIHVPVAYPQEAFTIVVSAPGYKVFTLKNYVSSAGNVIGVDMERIKRRKNWRHPFRKQHYATVGCISF